MRPKKPILCVDKNEIDLSVLSFMLETNGYRVLPASSCAEAIEVFVSTQVDLVLTAFSFSDGDGVQLVRQLKQIASHVPMILLCRRHDLDNQFHIADAALIKENLTAMDLLERIKIMTARKRGSRKGSHRVPFPPVVETVSLPCPSAAGPAA